MDSSPERFLSIYSPKSDSLSFFIENNALLNYEKNRFKSFCENEATSIEDASYKIIDEESDVENGNDSSVEEDSTVIVSDDDIENDFWKCSPEDQSREDNLASPCSGCLSGNVSLCRHIPETSAASESFDRKSYILGKLDITCKSVLA
ncbi:Flagellar L-ring protein [Trichinella spiralis]|uniref:Flagellar L-ring protein n=1 Tax=Trichinella spiralis TaxID=6334 RepID=A0ABR3KXH3_TRISP